MNYSLRIILVVLVLVYQGVASQEHLEQERILQAIEKRGKAFLKDSKIKSVSIGVFKDGKAYTRHYGELQKGQGNTPNNQTIYEVGSVTKTMTGYLAARAVLEGKFSLQDDIRNYLKNDYPNLEFNNTPITIKHLLTHTSGLPMFLPMQMNGVFEQLSPTVPNQYYELEKNYNKSQFLEDLSAVTLVVQPGTNYLYSNAGAELIGYILETVYAKSIDVLLQESFLDRYNMNATGIVLSDELQERLTQGYWMSNNTLSPNQLNTLWATGSGAKMTMNDMMQYVKLQLDPDNPIVSESNNVLYEQGKLLKVAYFWRVWNDKYGTSYNHHGGTSGMQNWLFIFPKYNMGISIMTNQSGPKTPNKLNKTIKKILKDLVKA